jgi:hypothetical protein
MNPFGNTPICLLPVKVDVLDNPVKSFIIKIFDLGSHAQRVFVRVVYMKVVYDLIKEYSENDIGMHSVSKKKDGFNSVKLIKKGGEIYEIAIF